eukprot:77460-Amphidinium_carterae.1
MAQPGTSRCVRARPPQAGERMPQILPAELAVLFCCNVRNSRLGFHPINSMYAVRPVSVSR